jgi:methionine synthase I (cobalamin-dependent)
MAGDIMAQMAAEEILIGDGAMGTMLLKAGIKPGTPSEAWVMERPEEILKVQRSYVEAGSNVILTCTFGATRPRLERSRVGKSVAEVNHRAVELARDAAGDAVWVAGDIGPTGEMMPPVGSLTVEDAVRLFAEQAGALAEAGVDLIYVETMSDLREAKAAVEGARQACDLPIFVTMSFDTRGRTNMGVRPEDAARELASMGVAALGANCGKEPEEMVNILTAMRGSAPDIPLIAKPNAGVPRMVKREVVYDATPERMASLAPRFVESGASLVGACCGSTPEHIQAMAAAVAQM